VEDIMKYGEIFGVTITLLLTAVALVACSGGADTVSGIIILPDGASVPEGATIQVEVRDTSLADAAATTMGQQIIDGDGQTGTIDFEVEYDADEIIDNHTYTMSVRIEDADGSLLFINDTSIPVITNGNPTEGVEVPVITV
jgi:putative lipoprotein